MLATSPAPGSTRPAITNHADALYRLEDHRRGSRGETLFRYRFPLSFASVGTASGRAHFAQMMHWLGETREIGIRPSGLYEAAIRHIAPGGFAWVTKESSLRVVGAATAGDLIEVECWNERLYGPHDSSLEMIYQWYAVSGDAERRPLAEAAQTTTWARVISHGVVEPAAYPNDMREWLASTLPVERAGDVSLSWRSEEPLGGLQWSAPPGPRRGLLLAEQQFSTTPRNANMVGNVYWANYFDWMGETRDLWVQSQVPFGSGELRCTQTEIQHLREAMPGDRVFARMYVQETMEQGLRLSFSFFRPEADGQETKLAQGTHEAVWYARAGGEWRRASLSLPELPR